MSRPFRRLRWSAALLGVFLVAIAPALLAAGAPAPAVSRHAVYLPLLAGGAPQAPGGPLTVRAELEPGRSATAQIGPEGGSVRKLYRAYLVLVFEDDGSGYWLPGGPDECGSWLQPIRCATLDGD